MTSKETMRQAAEVYFKEGLIDYLGDIYWTPLNRERAEAAARAAADEMSVNMDNCLHNVELSDHCVHWIADVTIKTEDCNETVEIPFNRVDSEEIHVAQVREFLAAFVKCAVISSGTDKLTPNAVRKVSEIIEEGLKGCVGCEANIDLIEAKFTGDNLLFCFSVFTDSERADEVNKVSITYEIPWPQK